MTEPPYTHTFDLFDSGTVTDCPCGCGTPRVPVPPTHTLSHVTGELDRMIRRARAKLTPYERIVADFWTEASATFMLYGDREPPTLSQEWSDRLWELAQLPERPTLEPSPNVRIRRDAAI
jgi:hypothetical protein